MTRILIACLMGIANLASLSAQDVAASPDAISQSHVYKRVGDVSLELTVYRRRTAQPQPPQPAIVFFFGGGWRSGSTKQFEPHAGYLASRGMVAVTADYRVASRHNVKADACVEDAKSAVRWLRQHAAQLNIDPQRICAAGGSAGGHIACCTATIAGLDASDEDAAISSRPDALALFNPALMIAPLEDFAFDFPEEKLADIASRTGVPPRDISPIHHVKANLPATIIFHGKADSTVPYATVAEYQRRAVAAGNRCELHGYADAPHGFFNAPKGNNAARRDRSDQWYRRTVFQLDVFLTSLGWLNGAPTLPIVDADFIRLRGELGNSRAAFARGTGRVAFLGGSITEMDGYRPIVCDWLQQQYPNTKFEFINAGIASTCSHTGAFRLSRDVLSSGPLDLLFVEFAVNDDQDAAHSAADCVAGMEGIIRQVRRDQPMADVIMTHFVNPGMLQTLRRGESIVSAAQHEKVAVHYSVPSVSLPHIVAAMQASAELTWQQYGGTHPGPVGNQLAADSVVQILKAGWTGTTAAKPHELPDKRLNRGAFDSGRLVSPESAATEQWSFSVPAWDAVAGGKRARFLSRALLHGSTPGAMTRFRFHGDAVGIYVLAGPDAGRVDFRVDGGEWQTRELYHRFSRSLHYPRTVMLATQLPDTDHTLELRIADSHHEQSRGHAVRIIAFAINAPGNARGNR